MKFVKLNKVKKNLFCKMIRNNGKEKIKMEKRVMLILLMKMKKKVKSFKMIYP